MKIERIKLTDVQVNEDNPRTISETKFEKLIASILVFPQMLSLRPVVVDENMVVLGGNMRLRSLTTIADMTIDAIQTNLNEQSSFTGKPEQEQKKLVEYWGKWLSNPEVTIVRGEDLTEDEKQQFIIKDNVGFGSWDWDMLANNWDGAKLSEWGLENWGNGVNENEIDSLFEDSEEDTTKGKDVVISVHIPEENAGNEQEIRTILKDVLLPYSYIILK